MTAPEPAWCKLCHPTGAENHTDDCCCSVKPKISSDKEACDG